MLESWTAQRQCSVVASVFVLALAVRLLAIAFSQVLVEPGDDPSFYVRVAEGLAHGEGYHEGSLLAFRPPLYPLFLSVFFKVFGEDLQIVRFAQAVLSAFTCVIVLRIGQRYFSSLVGIGTALFCAVYPELVHYAVQPWSETLFIFLVFATILSLWHWDGKHHYCWPVITGVLLGLAALTRSSGLFLVPAVIVWRIVHVRQSAPVLRHAVLCVASCAIVIAPWTIRNYVRFAHFVPIDTNGGVNFFIGNNPKATGAFEWALPPGTVWNQPSPNGANEIQASKCGYEEGLRFNLEHPGRAGGLLFRRCYYLLRPPYWTISLTDGPLKTSAKVVWCMMYTFIAAASLLVAPVYLARQWRRIALPMLAIVALSLPYLLTFGATRYRLPIEPFMCMISVYVLEKRFAVGSLPL